MKLSLLLASLVTATTLCAAADSSPAVQATNQFGLALHQRLAAQTPAANLCLSPYSIQTALAMAFAGADGPTREEMAAVLHYSGGNKIHGSFAALSADLAASVKKSAQTARDGKKWGGPREPITLEIANRLYGQAGFDFQKPCLTTLAQTYGAPFQSVDFAHPDRVRSAINGWVAHQTHDRIRDLLPGGALTPQTRLVLANALYFKAPWAKEFAKSATAPAPFHIGGGAARNVPTMQRQGSMGFAKGRGYRAIALPYAGDDLQFLILLPTTKDGLPALEKALTADTLAHCAKLPLQEVILSLPKFKLAAPTIALAPELQALGLKTAFDLPAGSADFSRLAPRRAGNYLALDQVFHQTFLALDEHGTEAAAATAVTMDYKGKPPDAGKPLEIKVDHPFLFALQHKPTGACLFLGRLTDPR